MALSHTAEVESGNMVPPSKAEDPSVNLRLHVKPPTPDVENIDSYVCVADVIVSTPPTLGSLFWTTVAWLPAGAVHFRSQRGHGACKQQVRPSHAMQ